MEPKEFDMEFVRGDTCPITFSVTDSQDNILDDLEGANIYFTVKESYSEPSFLIQKTYNGGTITKDGDNYSLTILPTDTENLEYGRYVYDICVVSQDLKATIVRGTITLSNEATFAINE